jgi:hypothetical protein
MEKKTVIEELRVRSMQELAVLAKKPNFKALYL